MNKKLATYVMVSFGISVIMLIAASYAAGWSTIVPLCSIFSFAFTLVSVVDEWEQSK